MLSKPANEDDISQESEKQSSKNSSENEKLSESNSRQKSSSTSKEITNVLDTSDPEYKKQSGGNVLSKFDKQSDSNEESSESEDKDNQEESPQTENDGETNKEDEKESPQSKKHDETNEEDEKESPQSKKDDETNEEDEKESPKSENDDQQQLDKDEKESPQTEDNQQQLDKDQEESTQTEDDQQQLDKDQEKSPQTEDDDETNEEDEKILLGFISMNSLCGKRIANLMNVYGDYDDKNFDIKRLDDDNEAEITIDPKICSTEDNTLDKEFGIPELEKLYYDLFNFKFGTFNNMSEDAKKDYNKDLLEFYNTFTGSTLSNVSDLLSENPPITKFSDIQISYKNILKDTCNKFEKQQNQEIKGRDNHFREYAKRLQSMIENTKKNQDKLLDILNQLFYIKKNKTPYEITINKTLNNQSLDKLIIETRLIIRNMYIECDKDYRRVLEVFKNIVNKIELKTLKRQKDEVNKLETESDTYDDSSIKTKLDTDENKVIQSTTNDDEKSKQDKKEKENEEEDDEQGEDNKEDDEQGENDKQEKIEEEDDEQGEDDKQEKIEEEDDKQEEDNKQEEEDIKSQGGKIEKNKKNLKKITKRNKENKKQTKKQKNKN
jgi:hypothetical protein